jgi:Fe-S oxidoreductase
MPEPPREAIGCGGQRRVKEKRQKRALCCPFGVGFTSPWKLMEMMWLLNIGAQKHEDINGKLT